MMMMMMMMMMMRLRAGSVGQLGREFWSQQCHHWSSGFGHCIHSQCHDDDDGDDDDGDDGDNHDNPTQWDDGDNDNEKFGLMLSGWVSTSNEAEILPRKNETHFEV